MPCPRILLPFLLLAPLLWACADNNPATPPQTADLVLVNGKIFTMDAQRSWAQALAIRDGRIVYVGPDSGAAAFRGESGQTVDLGGKMVLPGFQDVHIHPVSGGVAYTDCPLFDLDTLDQVLERVAGCVRDTPDASHLLARGWSWQMFIDGGEPHKRLLDAIDSSRPLVLGDSDGHTLWVNSAALALAGIDSDTPDPAGGEIGRDGNGEPSGILLEGPAMDMLISRLPAYTLEQKEAGLLYAQRYLHGLGVTAIQDAYVRLGGNEADVSLDAYRSLQQKGELKLRVVAALYWEPGAGLDQIGELVAARKKFSSGRLQATAVKFWADGIIESRTAMLLEPYTDKPETSGFLMVPLEEMLAAVPELDALGFQVHIHAIGDATVRYALDAFERARTINGERDSRHLTAHTQLVHPDDRERFAELDAIAGFSPYWARADSYVAEINPPQLGKERMSWMYPIRTVLDSGGRIAFGSDWSVSTADPLLGIETAVTRMEPEPDPENPPNPPFLPTERISLTQAIAGYTIDAAYANFLDRDTGSLEVGKYADLVVLSENLFDIPVEAISDARVLATLLEGSVVFGELPHPR